MARILERMEETLHEIAFAVEGEIACARGYVWASGADVAVVYGAASSWWKELFVADFDAGLYHGGFFADLATRLRELAKACRAPLYYVAAPGALIRHIEPHGVMAIEIPPWFESGRNPAFRRRMHQGRAGQVLSPDDRQDGDPPLGRGLELQGRRSGRRRAAKRILRGDFREVRSAAPV
jgi:hypothetical protein